MVALGALKVVGFVIFGIVVLGVAVVAVGFFEMQAYRESIERESMRAQLEREWSTSGNGFGGVNPCAAVMAPDGYGPLDSDVCG